jgi:hypothetical protein
MCLSYAYHIFISLFLVKKNKEIEISCNNSKTFNLKRFNKLVTFQSDCLTKTNKE